MAVGRKGEVMTDYIKREDALKAIKEYFVDPDKAISEHPDDVFRYNSGLQSALQVVFDIPSADVVERKLCKELEDNAYEEGYQKGLEDCQNCDYRKERKRGEWKHDIGDKWYCSCCFNVIYTEGSWEKPTKKFCDECGADMRKQTERDIDE